MIEEPTVPAVNFSGVSLPFDATDLLTGGVSLLGVVSGFVILALAFVIVPKLIGLVTGAMRSRSSN